MVDTQGVDVAFNYYFTNRWVADFSYSWFDFEVREKNERDQLLPNAPENKLNGGLAYTGHYAPVGNPSMIAFLDLG